MQFEMMRENKLEGFVAFGIKSIDLAGRIGLFLGGATLLIYCLRIGYFPRELSAGDGMLFIFMGLGFGLMYLTFTVCLTAIGIAILYPFHYLIACRLNKWLRNNDRKITIRTPTFPYPWVSWMYGFLAILFIWVLAKDDSKLYVQAPALSFLLYFVYISWKAATVVRGESTLALKPVLRPKMVWFCIWLLLPFLLGQVNGKLAEGVMRISGAQIDNAIVYVKGPIANLIPAPDNKPQGQLRILSDALGPVPPEGYKRFAPVRVQFRGIGKSTLIVVRNSTSTFQFEIPNDQVIVVRQPK